MRADPGRRGAILVTVMLAGLALLAAALAGATLATLHLAGARHAEAAGRARLAARSGLELVDAVLAAEFAEDGRLPDDAPRLPRGHGLELRIVGWDRRGDGEAEVELEARVDGAVAVAGGRLRYP